MVESDQTSRDDVPRQIRYEFNRSLSFVAVFSLWKDGRDESLSQLVDDILEPHQNTISYCLNHYPSLEPIVRENPVDAIEDTLRDQEMYEMDVLEDFLEKTRLFYEEEDHLPLELEVAATEVEGN